MVYENPNINLNDLRLEIVDAIDDVNINHNQYVQNVNIGEEHVVA